MSEKTKVSYTSHPIASLKIGKFQFERGALTLDEDEAVEFDALLEQQTRVLRSRVKKISIDAANRIAAEFLASRKTVGVDTTANSIEKQVEQPTDIPKQPLESQQKADPEPEKAPEKDESSQAEKPAEEPAKESEDKPTGLRFGKPGTA